MGWEIPAARSGDMAVHAALLPGGERGKVLYFGGYLVEDTHVYDVATRSVADIPTAASPGYNAFCSGHAFLADGRLLVGGGQLRVFDGMGQEIEPPPGKEKPHAHGGMGWGGERRCSIFRPLASAWSAAEPLNLDPAGNPESGGRWYPTLTTLPDGRVLAVGGHPDRRETYPAPFPDNRHNNNLPERYTPGHGWTLLGGDPPAEDQTTASTPSAAYDYQRNHTLPDGRVFFSSPVRGFNRFYDAANGHFLAAPLVALPGDPQYQDVSAQWTAVMLPLLHQEGHRARVLLLGGSTAQRIDLEADPPAWEPAAARAGWDGTPPERNFSVPVLLPDGRIFVSGGTAQDGEDDERQANAVRRAEIFTPGVDWSAGSYDPALESWETQSDAEAATVQRHYHSTALLLPDGSVWTAGSNGPSDEGGGRELRFEIYEPDYFDVTRPQVTACPPSTGYATPFPVGVDDAAAVERVALIRCGSVTHSFNPDQRYLTCDFQVSAADEIVVVPPADGAVAPPGRYTVWTLDGAGRPCELAPFLRLSKQKPYFTADVSTFSIHEVDALGPNATFTEACYLVFDGFLPSEITETPALTLEDADGDAVPGMSVALGAPAYEAGAGAVDTAQRIVYPITVSFSSMAAFDTFPESEEFATLTLHGQMGHFGCQTDLTLSRNPNPRMSDGNPHWLSVDLRVFKTKPDAEPVTAGIEHPSGVNAPLEYVNAVIDEYRDLAGTDDHPFDLLPTEQETNRLALYSHDDEGDPVYNYAIARVRYRAPEGIDAEDVRVFFRLWTTGWTALTFEGNPHADTGSYRRHGDGPDAAPLLGITGGEINNVPCFAEARVADMEQQDDGKNRWTFAGAGADEVHGYFGCWLDMNQDVPRFPEQPQGNGPFGGELKSIQELMRGLHQCLVAEIHWLDDPIPSFATPASSDNLAQRNILLDESDNPGGPAAHLVHHTFELKPSPFPLQAGAHLSATALAGRTHPDELSIHWGNLPRESLVTLFMPQVDAAAVVEYAARRLGPGNLVQAGPHEIACRVTDVGYVPLPGPLPQNIAALMTVQLPPGVVAGQRFSVVLRQIDGRRTRVVGTTQFDIAVAHAAELLPRFERNLSVLRHIATGIRPQSRWRPIFERYVGQLADRVRAIGGDPDAIGASPTGGGGPRPGHDHDDGHDHGDGPGAGGRPGHGHGGGPGAGAAHTGKVAELVYDCHGDFEGFVLDTCPGRRRFVACRGAVEELLRRACREQTRLTVWQREDDARQVARIVVHCC